MKSRARSMEGAEWVSAPTEMASTPVWAMAGMVCRLIPPEASVLQIPAQRATHLRSVDGGMLSSKTQSGRVSRASLSCSMVSTSTSIFRVGYFLRASATAASTPVACFFFQEARWLSLMSMASKRP